MLFRSVEPAMSDDESGSGGDWDDSDYEAPEIEVAAAEEEDEVVEVVAPVVVDPAAKYEGKTVEELIAELVKRDKEPKSVAPKKKAGKKMTKKQKRELEEAAQAKAQAFMEEEAAKSLGTELTAAEKVAATIAAKRKEKSADADLAEETLGIEGAEGVTLFEAMQPKTTGEFSTMVEAVVKKTSKYLKSPHYVKFIQDLCKGVCDNMKPDHIAKVASALQVLKTAKNATLKKAKQTKGKPQLGGSGKGGQTGGGYDRYAQDDFDDYM